MATDDPAGGDEELAAPRSGGRWRRVAVFLVVALLVAAVVVRLAQHHTTPTTAAPPSTTAVKGPVIPTFSKEHPPPENDTSQTFELGRHRTRATIYGPAPALVDTCYGKQCTSRFTVPRAVRTALRVAVPSCNPVLNDVVRHDPAHTRTEDRTVACVDLPTTLVVDIVRLHSSLRIPHALSDGMLVVAQHVHGPFTIQVFLQNRGGSLPKYATARALSEDPRLLAGMDHTG